MDSDGRTMEFRQPAAPMTHIWVSPDGAEDFTTPAKPFTAYPHQQRALDALLPQVKLTRWQRRRNARISARYAK